MIRFLRNRRLRTIDSLDPNTSVLDYLRDHLFLKGTKEGCASGDCGACTVTVGELHAGRIRYKAINACITPLATMHGKQLITIEDLDGDGKLHPAQRALLGRHGSQCGFCTPGIVMSMFACWKRGDRTTRQDIVNALGGNLCRCTGYRPIIDAALAMFTEHGDDAFTRYEQETVTTLQSLNRSVETVTLGGNGKRYFAPHSSDELARLYRHYPDARLLAGGTDLCLEITQSLNDLDTIIDVGRVRELLAIEDGGGDTLVIGAGVSLSDCSEVLVRYYPDMRELLDRFGSRQIRNAGTIGGNIANASPVADMPVALMAIGGSLVLRCGDKRRHLDLEDYFIRYKHTAGKTSEFIEQIVIPKPRPGYLFRFYKLSKRIHDDISSVCAAFYLHIDGAVVSAVRVAFGGMGEIPARARNCEQALLGSTWNEAAMERATRALERDCTPVSDLRASAEYRMQAARNLLVRLFNDAGGGEPGVRVTDRASLRQDAAASPSGSDPGHGAVAGKPLPHDSAARHVCGTALYTDDLPALAGMLYACVGLSDHARARIISMDLDAVRKGDGVVEVLTPHDIPGTNDIGPVFPGDPVLAEGDVEFWGQPLFAVAARSQRLARRAARLAKVRYEPLEACLDVEAALQSKNFIRPSLAFRRGDPAAACEKAPHRLQGEVRIGGQEHFYLEGQVSLAIPAEEGCMTLHTSSQNPTQIQQAVARVLGVPMNHITVEVRRMGGAFGGKETQAAQWACIAALLAHKTGRPVKCRLARVDDMTVTGKRHPFLCRHSVGFDDEGRILGLEMELSANCGFSADLSDAVVDRAMLHADNGYHLTDVRITGNRCKTNIVSSTAFRGFGAPQAMVAMEGVMDDISRYLGRDPLEVRKINLYAEGGGRHITHYGQAIEQLVLGDIISRLEQSSGYQARREAIIRFNRDNRVFRKGIALTPVKFGISFSAQHLNQAGALLHVYTDGSIHLNHGGTEMGQGLLIKVAQVWRRNSTSPWTKSLFPPRVRTKCRIRPLRLLPRVAT